MRDMQELAEMTSTLNTLVNLDTLYCDCHDGHLCLLGYKNGVARYTASFPERTERIT
jgi:hypothetical protein